MNTKMMTLAALFGVALARPDSETEAEFAAW